MLYHFAEKYDISIKLQAFLPHYKILLSVRNQVTFLRKWAHKKCYVLSANDVSRISDAEQSLKNEGEPQWSVYSICILNWGGKGTTTYVLSEYYYILSVLWFGTCKSQMLLTTTWSTKMYVTVRKLHFLIILFQLCNQKELKWHLCICPHQQMYPKYIKYRKCFQCCSENLASNFNNAILCQKTNVFVWQCKTWPTFWKEKIQMLPVSLEFNFNGI